MSSISLGNMSEAFCHLCQPDGGKSCGACCGLYNYADSSREALTLRLKTRTERFRRDVRGTRDLDAFSRITRATEDQARLFAEIHCCEYAGFLDDAGKRVGCLLHPAQNNGCDLRGVSFYGQELCSGHLCPSYSFLNRTEKLVLIDLIDDWYLYGLCVTDIDLIKEYLRHVGNLLGEAPTPAMFLHQDVRRIARRFFAFKLAWPFRSAEINRFGRFYFDGSQYMVRPIDYAALGCDRSRFDSIFLSLCSEFSSPEALRAAEALIRENIEGLAAAWGNRS